MKTLLKLFISTKLIQLALSIILLYYVYTKYGKIFTFFIKQLNTMN